MLAQNTEHRVFFFGTNVNLIRTVSR